MKKLLERLAASPSEEDYVSDDRKFDQLNAIRKVESNDGKYTDHGSDAIGDYGLRPMAIQDAMKIGNVEDLKAVVEKMKDDPKLQREAASKYYDILNKTARDDEDKIAYGWLNGPTGLKRAMASEKNIKDHWHVKKFQKLKDKLEK